MAFKLIFIVASLIAIVNGYGYAYAGFPHDWNHHQPPPMYEPMFTNFPGFPNFPMPHFPAMPPMPTMPPMPPMPDAYPLHPDSVRNMKGEGVNAIYASAYSKIQKDKDGKPIRKKGGEIVINNDGEVFEKTFGDPDQSDTTSDGSK